MRGPDSPRRVPRARPTHATSIKKKKKDRSPKPPQTDLVDQKPKK